MIFRSLCLVLSLLVTDVEPLVMDANLHHDFKWNLHLNQFLKAPHSDDCYDPITTGQLKMVPRILLCLVSHVLHPKNSGFSRINNA